MDERALQYSLQENLTLTELKNGDWKIIEKSRTLRSRMLQHHVGVCIQDDEEYHFKFRTIKSSPYLYYWVGHHDVLHLPLLGIVGPRKMSSYARKILEQLFRHLQHYRVATVSGMAPGVDSLCHELSISHGLPTVAVLGGGLGYFLKSSKRHHIHNITHAGGLVISEFKLGMKPTLRSYPQRNRLIAGLSQCLFVPEASEGSGSLITVDDAVGMHKMVYGVPHHIFHVHSAGLLRYMADGKVALIVDLEAFLHKEFGRYTKKNSIGGHTRDYDHVTGNQKNILQYLSIDSGESLHSLSGKLGLDTGEIMSELTMMEMMGLVEEVFGKWVLL